MVINRFGGWLDFPDYYFFWNYHGHNSIFNISTYQNPGDGQADRRGPFRAGPGVYRRNVETSSLSPSTRCRSMPIAQPLHDVAMQKTIGGYQFWPSREPDFRYLTKG